MKSSLATISVLLLMCVGPHAQQETLRDRVLRTNRPINRIIGVDGPTTSLVELLKVTDLAVRGVIADSSARLSADGRDVLTEHRLRDAHTIYPQETAVAGTPRPGIVPPPIIVTQLGGTMIIEGHQVRVEHQALPVLNVGTETLFLLTRTENGLRIAKEYLGVFSTERNVLEPLTSNESFAVQHRGTTLDQFVGELISIKQLQR